MKILWLIAIKFQYCFADMVYQTNFLCVTTHFKHVLTFTWYQVWNRGAIGEDKLHDNNPKSWLYNNYYSFLYYTDRYIIVCVTWLRPCCCRWLGTVIKELHATISCVFWLLKLEYIIIDMHKQTTKILDTSKAKIGIQKSILAQSFRLRGYTLAMESASLTHIWNFSSGLQLCRSNTCRYISIYKTGGAQDDGQNKWAGNHPNKTESAGCEHTDKHCAVRYKHLPGSKENAKVIQKPSYR